MSENEIRDEAIAGLIEKHAMTGEVDVDRLVAELIVYSLLCSLGYSKTAIVAYKIGKVKT